MEFYTDRNDKIYLKSNKRINYDVEITCNTVHNIWQTLSASDLLELYQHNLNKMMQYLVGIYVVLS